MVAGRRRSAVGRGSGDIVCMPAAEVCYMAGMDGGRGMDRSICEGWRMSRQEMFAQFVSGVAAIRITGVAFAAGMDQFFRHLVAEQPDDRLPQRQELDA